MIKLLSVALCLLTPTLALYPYAEENHIINIGLPTWDTAYREFPAGLLVYYYEPYCLPCREFWPEYIKAANEVVNTHSAVRIARVECHDEVELCNQRGVFAFPALRLYKTNQGEWEYRGPRTSQDLLAWISKVIDGSAPKVSDIDALFSNFSLALVASGMTPAVGDAYKLGQWDEVAFATPDGDVKSKVGDKSAALLTQDGEVVEFDVNNRGDIDAKIQDVLYASKRAVPNFNFKNADAFEKAGQASYIIFFRTDSFKATSNAAKEFNKAYKELGSNDVKFAYASVATDAIGYKYAKMFGVDEEKDSVVGIINKQDAKFFKYKLTGEITKDNIKTFLSDFSGNKLQKYYMSEDKTVINNYVQHITGNDYASITGDKDKNVLVMLYAPRCEDCVKTYPTWDALAYRVREFSDIVIAKVNVATNDVPGYEGAQLPKILLYSKDNKTPVEYTEARNMKSLMNFLVKNAKSGSFSYDL